MFHAEQMPLVEMRGVEVENLGGGSFAVTATVENTRLMPTISARAREKKIGLPDFFSLSGDAIEVAAAGLVTDRDFDRVDLVELEPHRLRIESGLGSVFTSSSLLRARWYVSGNGDFEVRYESQKGGRALAKGTLAAADESE